MRTILAGLYLALSLGGAAAQQNKTDTSVMGDAAGVPGSSVGKPTQGDTHWRSRSSSPATTTPPAQTPYAQSSHGSLPEIHLNSMVLPRPKS
jgi:hypothetical protein